MRVPEEPVGARRRCGRRNGPAGFGGGLEPLAGGADGGLVGIGPGGVVVEARGEAEDDEDLILRGGLGGGGGGIGGCIGGVGTEKAGVTPARAGKKIRQERGKNRRSGKEGRDGGACGIRARPRPREERRPETTAGGAARCPDPGPRAGGKPGGG